MESSGKNLQDVAAGNLSALSLPYLGCVVAADSPLRGDGRHSQWPSTKSGLSAAHQRSNSPARGCASACNSGTLGQHGTPIQRGLHPVPYQVPVIYDASSSSV